LFSKAISGAPIKIGTNQLPNPPIKIGITMIKVRAFFFLISKLPNLAIAYDETSYDAN
jgi:hypothetical protein